MTINPWYRMFSRKNKAIRGEISMKSTINNHYSNTIMVTTITIQTLICKVILSYHDFPFFLGLKHPWYHRKYMSNRHSGWNQYEASPYITVQASFMFIWSYYKLACFGFGFVTGRPHMFFTSSSHIHINLLKKKKNIQWDFHKS